MAYKVLSLSSPVDLLKPVQKIAKEENRTKSELVREALRQFIEEREWRALRRYGARRAKRLGISEEDVEQLVDEIRK